MGVSVEKPIVVEDSVSSFVDGKFVNQTLTGLCERDSHLIFDFPTVYVISAKRQRNHPLRQPYIVYVGETNSIESRTNQHVKDDPKSREDWLQISELMSEDPESVRQYVIGHPHFNKSMTLDIENKLMHYLLGVSVVAKMNNRRTNPQGDYYPRKELDGIFRKAWRALGRRNPELFPSLRVVQDSALFKASPFHELSKEQLVAADRVIAAVRDAVSSGAPDDSEFGRLILVTGGAGTGKTVLISHLFNQLVSELNSAGALGEAGPDLGAPSWATGAYLLVNHNEQKNVYNGIAVKLDLQDKRDQVVLKPSQFIIRLSEKRATKSGRLVSDVSRPSAKADVALIDEAHLLLTQGSQGYQGSNMLLDVMRRAKVTVAVFDPAQILDSSQQWDQADLDLLLGAGADDADGSFHKVALFGGASFERAAIRLSQQFRIAASDDIISWIDDFASRGTIGPIPPEALGAQGAAGGAEGYEIKVFDSPVELFSAIRRRASEEGEGRGISRVLATYDWAYSSVSANPNDPDGGWNVELHRGADGQWLMGLAEGDGRGFVAGGDESEPDRFCHPWNYILDKRRKERGAEKAAWAERPETIEEVGSTFTIQGFDLNYAGLIIGPSAKYVDGRVVFDASSSKNSKATNKRDGTKDFSYQNLSNELNVLLKRGVHGLYLFAVDPDLQEALKRAASEGGSF